VHFLIDAQLPPALADFLIENGHSASSARDLKLRDAEDEVIWERARVEGMIIVTKDEDFAQMSWRYGAPPQVMWLRIGNATNRALFAWLKPILQEACDALLAGNPLVEVI
jgi:predicted nuclease of predicted toxin-antitoxin system